MRVLAYYRVSSAHQRDADTIASQRRTARSIASNRGWTLTEFEDDGRSASKQLAKRTGFLAFLDAVRAGCDGVLIVAFDRLTRSIDLAEQGMILGTIQAARVPLYVGSGEEIDLGTFGGRVSAVVRAQLAAEESAVKSDRARRGRDRSARAGKPPCPPPWGYAYKDGHWVPGPGAALIREVWTRTAGGESLTAIALDFTRRKERSPRGGRWYTSAVSRLFAAEVYTTGAWRASGDVVIQLPVLIDPETASRARQLLRSGRYRGLRKTRRVYLLEALATCARCGAPVRIEGCVKRKGGYKYDYRYYTCEANRRPCFYDDKRCPERGQRTDAIDERVWAAVVDWLSDPDLVRRALPRTREAASEASRQAAQDLAGWRTRLAALPELEAEALRLRERGLLSVAALEARLGEVARRRALLERQLVTAGKMAQGAVEAGEVAARLAEALEALRGRAHLATAEERRELVRLLVPGGWTVGADEVRGQVWLAAGVGTANPATNQTGLLVEELVVRRAG